MTEGDDSEDDPVDVARWLGEHRARVAEYLHDEGVLHGAIAVEPAWHIAPHVSIWEVGDAGRPQWRGWWVICGDLPTDYVPAEGIEHARDAMRAFGERWYEAASYMARGESYPGMEIGTPSDWPTLVPLLISRAELLKEWANLDSVWGNWAP